MSSGDAVASIEFPFWTHRLFYGGGVLSGILGVMLNYFVYSRSLKQNTLYVFGQPISYVALAKVSSSALLIIPWICVWCYPTATTIAAMAHLLCVKCISYIFIVGQVAAACVSMLAFPPASDQVQTLVWSVLYHTIFSNPFGFVAAYSHWGTRHAVLKWCNHKTSRMLSILLVGVSVISRVRYCWMTSMVPVTSSRSALVIRILIRQVPRLRATMFERRA